MSIDTRPPETGTAGDPNWIPRGTPAFDAIPPYAEVGSLSVEQPGKKKGKIIIGSIAAGAFVAAVGAGAGFAFARNGHEQDRIVAVGTPEGTPSTEAGRVTPNTTPSLATAIPEIPPTASPEAPAVTATTPAKQEASKATPQTPEAAKFRDSGRVNADAVTTFAGMADIFARRVDLVSQNGYDDQKCASGAADSLECIDLKVFSDLLGKGADTDPGTTQFIDGLKEISAQTINLNNLSEADRSMKNTGEVYDAVYNTSDIKVIRETKDVLEGEFILITADNLTKTSLKYKNDPRRGYNNVSVTIQARFERQSDGTWGLVRVFLPTDSKQS